MSDSDRRFRINKSGSTQKMHINTRWIQVIYMHLFKADIFIGIIIPQRLFYRYLLFNEIEFFQF